MNDQKVSQDVLIGGIAWCVPIFGPLAIWLGVIALRYLGGQYQPADRALAWAGVALGGCGACAGTVMLWVAFFS